MTTLADRASTLNSGVMEAGPQTSIRWHVITSEYPPQPGGVSDYTHGVASGLAASGDEVHVWCPNFEGPHPPLKGVSVHRELGAFAPSDLLRVGRRLDRFAQPRRILVQWVPHGYGYRSMNLAFCLWLWIRSALRRDRVEIMLHEPSLPFSRNSFRQSAAALMHRLMTIVLLRATKHVWMSIPGWEARLRPYALYRDVSFRWLPVPSNIPVTDDARGIAGIRDQYARKSEFLIGHFGTYGPPVASLLLEILPGLLSSPSRQTVLLMGQGSDRFREQFVKAHPALASNVVAAGSLAPEELSRHISACDLLLQPYPDGVSSRRTTVMVGLCHAKPIVTTAGEFTESLWFESRAVAMRPVGDTGNLIRLVDRLRHDENERARLGATAKMLYHQRFDIGRVVSALRGSALEQAVRRSG